MNKNHKIKPAPQTFYICDRTADCHGSGLCGMHCFHTTKIRHAKYDEHKDWKLMKNGDRFEMDDAVKDKFMNDQSHPSDKQKLEYTIRR